MQLNLPMSLEEVFNRLALVSREVISDHVDLFATRLIGDDVDEECYELGRRVACRGLPSTSPVLVLKAAYQESVPWR